MLVRPRRWIRAAVPRVSRSWILGTVNRSASHAVLAPDAAIWSWVTTFPRSGGTLACWGCVPEPPHAATRVVPSSNRRATRMRMRLEPACRTVKTVGLPLRASDTCFTIWNGDDFRTLLHSEEAWSKFPFAAFFTSSATSLFPVDVVASRRLGRRAHCRAPGLIRRVSIRSLIFRTHFNLSTREAEYAIDNR